MLIENEIKELHESLQMEVFDGSLNTGEVYFADLLSWYNWRLKNEPMEGDGFLKDFDLDSIILIFKDWAQKPLMPAK